jgi:hypothetical protein
MCATNAPSSAFALASQQIDAAIAPAPAARTYMIFIILQPLQTSCRPQSGSINGTGCI